MTWYTGNTVYDSILIGAFVYVLLVAISAPFIDTPYGRFGTDKMGIRLNPRWGWFLMELPATLSFLYFYCQGKNRGELVPLIFLVIWLIHYGNRGFLFPYLIRTAKGAQASFNLAVVLFGWIATSLHGYLNAAFISDLSTQYTREWLTDPRFLLGVAIYYTGFLINVHSDAIVRNLRSKEEIASGAKNYRIPYGGLFKYVTCPSYLGELIAWTGFAICTWSLGAVFVLAISIANLVPRAFATHRWYHEKFKDYPRERKVLIPFLI